MEVNTTRLPVSLPENVLEELAEVAQFQAIGSCANLPRVDKPTDTKTDTRIYNEKRGTAFSRPSLHAARSSSRMYSTAASLQPSMCCHPAP